MSRLFIDTEFNGHNGELISMALVSDDGREWYQVYDFPGSPGEWVAKHVIPYLDKAPIGWSEMQGSLAVFLSQFNGCEIIADWPADFEHLCRMMTGIGAQAGFMMPIECTMRLLVSPELFPEQPHNALSDARALRDWYLAQEKAA